MKWIVLIDEDGLPRKSLTEFLRLNGCEVSTFAFAEDALGKMEEIEPKVAICEYKLGSGMSGIMFFKEMSEAYPHFPVILISKSWFVSELAEEEGCRFAYKDDKEELFAALEESQKPRAVIVAIADPEKEAEAIREWEEKGYIVHIPFEDAPDSLGAKWLKEELGQYKCYSSVEIVTE